MKTLMMLFITICIGFGATTEVSITSDSFEASEGKHKTTFTGHVVIKKLSDIIKSNQAVIEFDKENKPVKYKAIKDVTFEISLEDSKLQGKCKELSFVPKSKVYTLTGDVDLLQLPTNRKIKAAKVIIDTKINKINITGEKNKPVKFIFEVEDK